MNLATKAAGCDHRFEPACPVFLSYLIRLVFESLGDDMPVVDICIFWYMYMFFLNNRNAGIVAGCWENAPTSWGLN